MRFGGLGGLGGVWGWLYSTEGDNYTKTQETVDYAKSRLFATKQTTGLFGANDNRLGGSKTAYKSDYKPQNPNPKFGPIYYDAVWDFKG